MANALVIAADDGLDLYGAKLPPKHVGQALLRDQLPPPALFLNLDAAHASAEETPEREFNPDCSWLLPEPRREGWRRPLLMTK